MVPFHEFQCQDGAPGRAGCVIQTENLIPRPLLPQKKTLLAAAERDATRLAGGGSGCSSPPDPISCCSPAAAPEPKANPCRQRGGKGPGRAPFPDGHGPSVPSVLDIPAEPFRRSPPATRWKFRASCRPQGNVPRPGDTAAAGVRGSLRWATRPPRTCLRWPGDAGPLSSRGRARAPLRSARGQGWRGIATWLPLGGLRAPEEGYVILSLLPIIPLGLY